LRYLSVVARMSLFMFSKDDFDSIYLT
jgi:hypothetical protein